MSICVITRADDCGLGSGSNAAVYEAVLSGFIKNVSFMACGPAIREASKLFRGTEVCCGMHFVITGEWERMPLRPVLPAEEVPSLVDEEGFFYPDTTFGGTLPAIEDIKKEWYAQLRLLRSLGFKIAYADTHMFPELAVPGLLEEMSSWIKKEGLIDHRYYYRALPCMNDLARVTGLWEKTAARLTDGIWYYIKLQRIFAQMR